MVSRSLCSPDLVRHASIQPGRLMHIKLCFEPCVEVLAVYQHAWRPDATAKAKEALLAEDSHCGTECKDSRSPLLSDLN